MVFTAKVYGILRAAAWLINQATLKALMSPLITSKTLRECRNGLNCIYRFNTMKLLREVGHCHVEVNEISYSFNLISPIPGPEPAIGVSVGLAKVVIKSWEQASHMDRWQIVNAVSTHQTVPA